MALARSQLTREVFFCQWCGFGDRPGGTPNRPSPPLIPGASSVPTPHQVSTAIPGAPGSFSSLTALKRLGCNDIFLPQTSIRLLPIFDRHLIRFYQSQSTVTQSNSTCLLPSSPLEAPSSTPSGSPLSMSPSTRTTTMPSRPLPSSMPPSP